MKFAIDGKEWISSGSFVSKAIYEAYQRNQNWNPEQFCKVELSGVLPAWITLNEKVQLEQRKTFDEIEKFTAELDLKVIEVEDFERWKSGIC